MAKAKLSINIQKQIDKAVKYYETKQELFVQLARNLHDNLTDEKKLRQLIHSTKFRVKDPEHLRNKLERKAYETISKKKSFTITEGNLFTKIEDLAGVRLIHLHTDQMTEIHSAIMDILGEHKYILVGKPIAYTWDIEYEQFFKSIGLKTDPRDSMYTSVHYIIEPNRKTKMRCELQVRTLMEEVWGEVSHIIDYPDETESIACKKQLKVLARVTSSGTRLVDSIFASKAEYKKIKSK